MHDMMKRHEVQVLRRAGVTQEQVAKLTGISVRSVRMIEAEAPVVVLDEDEDDEDALKESRTPRFRR
jgi:DNA-binding XRE family transcriptional regulator